MAKEIRCTNSFRIIQSFEYYMDNVERTKFPPYQIAGRYLFNAATRMYEEQKDGKVYIAPSLGDIVMVESVAKARDRKVLNCTVRSFTENSVV